LKLKSFKIYWLTKENLEKVSKLKFRDYVVKRLLLLIPVIIGVSLLSYVLAFHVGDPIASYVGTRQDRLSQADIDRYRHSLGLDGEWYEAYFRYVGRLLQGDWGVSPTFLKQPVLKILQDRFPATVELAIASVIIALLAGIPLGIISAVKQDKFADHLSRLFALSGVSIPIFWLALMMQVAVVMFNNAFPFLPPIPYYERYNVSHYFKFGYPPTTILGGTLPATGFLMIDGLLNLDFNFFLDSVAHLLLPSLALSWAAMAVLQRMTRMSMVETLRQDYILLAKSKGLKERTIIYRHALRNAIIPTLTVAGLVLAGLLGGAVLTETVFDWPGIGSVAAQAVFNLDLSTIQGFVILSAIIYVSSNLIVDLLYAFIDPRIRFD
jgi:peptide/nickel transport system permease protein